MSLKATLKSHPVLYEIVPPRRDTSRYQSELRGVEDVLHDGRITAVNVPELTRRHEAKHVRYSPVTIPPEEYALLIREYKEPVVNVIAPRLPMDEFLGRARKILRDYRIPNLVLVGKEKHQDRLPGPGVLEGLAALRPEKGDGTAFGGICIFDRGSAGSGGKGRGAALSEAERVLAKARAGCDFVTSQIAFDPRPALGFLASYEDACMVAGVDPVTVFVSLTTVPTLGILSLLESLDVVVPPKLRKRLAGSSSMGKASVDESAKVFDDILAGAEKAGVSVPLGVQVEQVGVNSGGFALDLLDRVLSSFG